MELTRIVYYARVSTRTDEQLYALENQVKWYERIIQKHPEWVLVGSYIDEGKSGTSTKRRKNFNKMMEDGLEHHKFELIITRQVERFARNTLDSLNSAYELKKAGIGIYFVLDNINTNDETGDWEKALADKASMAQEYSRKNSIAVKEGQAISRQEGILRGTGNILGYDKPERNVYTVNEEQAKTVRLIFDMYLAGNGVRAIKSQLQHEGHLTATGKARWQEVTICKVLSNPFYTGYQRNRYMISDGYLTQRRIRNYDGIEYIEGTHEPLVTEEEFEQVQEIKLNKTRNLRGNPTGCNVSKKVLGRKILCNCGSRCGLRSCGGKGKFQFKCTFQFKNGNVELQRKMGIPEEEICDLEPISKWKVELMLHDTLERAWKSGKEEIKQAMQKTYEQFELDLQQISSKVKETEDYYNKLIKRKDNLINMRADGEIGKEEYIAKVAECETQLKDLEQVRDTEKITLKLQKDYEQLIKESNNTLKASIDFTRNEMSDRVIEKIIGEVVHVSPHTYKIFLKLSESQYGKFGTETHVIPYKVFQWDESQQHRIVKCTKVFEHIITLGRAKEYRASQHRQIKYNRWHDTKVTVYV